MWAGLESFIKENAWGIIVGIAGGGYALIKNHQKNKAELKVEMLKKEIAYKNKVIDIINNYLRAAGAYIGCSVEKEQVTKDFHAATGEVLLYLSDTSTRLVGGLQMLDISTPKDKKDALSRLAGITGQIQEDDLPRFEISQ